MSVNEEGAFLNVLLVDRNEGDYLLTRELLARVSRMEFRLDWVSDFHEAIDAISRQAHDLYLIDGHSDGSRGLELIRIACERDCTAPMLLLTGPGEGPGETASEAGFLEAGLLDAPLLERAIRYTLQQKRHSEQLERKVAARTAELAETNAILQAEIVERKRAESALRDADRRKDEFLATLAHELRNPLAPICNALEILRIAGDRTDIREAHRAMIDRQVQQMVRLIDDILDVSRISRGKIQLRKERVALGSLFEGAVESIQPNLDRSRHTLNVILPDPRLAIEADSMRLGQIVLNLLNNACKFTEPGGRIELEAAQDGDDVCIRVRDNGIGIPANQIPNLFKMFAQIQSAPDQSRSGLGIGLSLVDRLVALHGGTVKVQSEGPGLGTEFIVRIPIRHQDEAMMLDDSD